MSSSVLRKWALNRRLDTFLSTGEDRLFHVHDQKLKATLHLQPEAGRPIIAILPGWLGSGDSSYALGFAHRLWQSGYSVARLTLRDHGETAELNETMFNSALTDEVVAFVQTATAETDRAGVLGFSLGGNFALRVARADPSLEVLAVCPAIEPRSTMHSIDRNIVYQRYFLNKWRDIWKVKATTFDNRYRLSDITSFRSIQTLTEHFVHTQTSFGSMDEYFDAYDLSNNALDGVQAHVLVARDDPIIPFSHFRNLPDSIDIEVTDRGGHGAYLKNWRLESWLDDYVSNHFARVLPVKPLSGQPLSVQPPSVQPHSDFNQTA